MVSHMEILQKVYNEYRCLDISEMIHSGVTAIVCRDTQRVASRNTQSTRPTKRAVVDLTVENLPKFPPNYGNLICIIYY